MAEEDQDTEAEEGTEGESEEKSQEFKKAYDVCKWIPIINTFLAILIVVALWSEKIEAFSDKVLKIIEYIFWRSK